MSLIVDGQCSLVSCSSIDRIRARLELRALDTDCQPTMPPVQLVGDIPGIFASALFLDKRDVLPESAPDLVPVDESTVLLAARSDTTTKAVAAGKGSISPQDVNMHAIQAVFAIIGAAFVLGAIWFFFWAKNGGFVWRKGDWDEYKSTVLRRKGPDGRTLSNATASTKLGGGSIVGRGYSDEDGWTVTDTAAITETATEVTEEKPRKKRNLKETAKQKLLRKRKEEKWEGEADEDVRAYRREKAARVGGINQEPDGTYHGSDYTPTAPSEYNSSDMTETRPLARPHESRRNRNFSFETGSEDVLSRAAPEEYSRQDNDSHSSARRQQRRRERERERERSRAHRSSRQNSPRHSSPRHSSPRKRERSSVGNYHEPLDFSSAPSHSEYQYSTVETDDGTGTKSYHHPIPALSKGYRRDGRSRRRDSLSDSDGEESRRR